MIAFCLICEGAIRFVDTPIGIEAVCSDCYAPVDDAAEVECLRGIGEDKRDAVEDLYRVQNEYLEDSEKTMVANLFDDLREQLQQERAAQLQNPTRYIVGPFETTVPRKAIELAKWAAQGK